MIAADVFQGENLLAHLTRTPTGTALHYREHVSLDPPSLATLLPYSLEPIESQSLHPFFLNLLPEGIRLRLLMDASRSKDDLLEILLKIGWDTTGDVDMHAKNISLLWSQEVGLSPAYDVLSTLPYPKLDRHMAPKMAGRDDNFRVHHFVEFAKRHGIDERAVTSSIQRICKKAEPWLHRLPEIGFDEKTTEAMSEEIAVRLRKLTE